MKLTRTLTTALITLIILSCFISFYKVENASAINTNGTIVFRETGLASGTSWTINIQGTNFTTTNSQYSIDWSVGIPCPYTIYVPAGYTSSSTLTGTLYVSSGTTTYVDVVFTADASYFLTMNTVGEGTVSPGNQTYSDGTTVNLQAMPADGWSFSGWSGDASGTSNTTLTMTGNKTVTATFTRDSYNLTVAVYLDNVLLDTGVQQYPAGYNVSGYIDELPDDQEFDHLEIDGVNSTDTFYSILMDQDHTLTLYLKTKTVTLTIQSATGGTTNPTTGNYTITFGEEANVTATPDQGYSFSHWLLDGETNSTSNLITVKMDGNHTLTPVFIQDQPPSPTQYQITIISSHGNSNGIYTVTSGDSFTASVTSPVTVDSTHRWICTGYRIDGGQAIEGTEYTFTDINSDHEITFLWEEQYFIQFVSNPASAGSTTQNQWMTTGTHAIQATAANNYIFTCWTTSGNATFSSADSASTTVTITGSAIITANFESTNTLIATKTTTNQTYLVSLTGNITAQQMTNMTITPHAENSTTNIAFTVTGPTGQTGNSTIALPKNAIPYGTKPLVYIDGVLAENQTCTEDSEYYYISYIIHFSTHSVSIVFTTLQDENPTPTATPEPTSTPQPTTTPTVTATPNQPTTPAATQNPTDTDPTLAGIPATIAAAIALIALVLVVVGVVYRKKRKNETA